MLPEYMVPGAYVEMENVSVDGEREAGPEGIAGRRTAGRTRKREYEAPVGEVEQELARIWAEVLNLKQIGRKDNFFEIGGHSLLVFRAAGLLQQAGIAAEIADFFNHPTIESLAASLRHAHPIAHERGVLRIREGSQLPLFLVHDGYGDELYFSVLAQYLPRELPVYGLPGISPNEAPLHTMEAMAERMVRLIQQVQGAGPYRVAGWSFGGVLAYEIARQLLDQRHAVEFLGLMDCLAGDGLADNRQTTPEAVLIELCEEERAQRPGAESATATFDANGSNPDFTALFNHYRGLRALPAKLERLSPQEAIIQCRNLEINSRVMGAYRPRPLDVPVHLFVASQRPQGWPVPSPWLGWERCVPAHLLCTQAVPGSHYSMMTAPHVQVLGQKLAGALIAAEIKVCH